MSSDLFLDHLELDLGDRFKSMHPTLMTYAMLILLDYMNSEDPITGQLLLSDMWFQVEPCMINLVKTDRKLAIAGGIMERYFSEMGDFKRMIDVYKSTIISCGRKDLLASSESFAKALIESYRSIVTKKG